MKASKAVVKQLKLLLAGELAARDQYFIHSRMYEDWGLQKLYAQLDHEMQEETGHADAIIKRLLFLENQPDLNQQNPINVGKNVPEMLKNDLALEYQVVAALKEAIAVCESEQDYVSRELLVKQLDDTEQDHAHWLEQQLGLIEKIGLQNYLQNQMQS